MRTSWFRFPTTGPILERNFSKLILILKIRRFSGLISLFWNSQYREFPIVRPSYQFSCMAHYYYYNQVMNTVNFSDFFMFLIFDDVLTIVFRIGILQLTLFCTYFIVEARVDGIQAIVRKRVTVLVIIRGSANSFLMVIAQRMDNPIQHTLQTPFAFY